MGRQVAWLEGGPVVYQPIERYGVIGDMRTVALAKMRSLGSPVNNEEVSAVMISTDRGMYPRRPRSRIAGNVRQDG
jgi:hypothetical protein